MTQSAPVTQVLDPKSALDLPVELLNNIVCEAIQRQSRKDADSGEVVDGTWHSNVSALSLVSRAYTRECQIALFRSIYLHPEKYSVDGEYRSGAETLSKFAELMATSAHLGCYVKDVIISLPRWSDIFKDSPAQRAVASALDRISHLSTLSLRVEDRLPMDDQFFYGGKAPHELLREATLRLMKRPTLTHLKLRNIKISLKSIYDRTDLESLELSNVCMWSDLNWPLPWVFLCRVTHGTA